MQSSNQKAGKSKFDYGWVIVGTCLIIGIVGFGVQYSFGVFFKSIEAEFGWSRASTSSIFSIFMVLTPIFGILGGWLMDRYGPRIVISLGGLITSLGLLLTSQISTPWHVFVTYSLLIAMGTGPLFPVLMSTVSKWFIKRRGAALGAVTSSVGLGMAVMAPIAAYLIASYGWRTSYLTMSLIAFLGMIPLAQVLKRAPAELPPPQRQEAVRHHPGQNASERDFSLPQALRSRNLWLILFMWFLCALCLGIIATHIIPHATDLGIAPTEAAVILSLVGGISMVGKLIMGRISDSIGRKRTAIIAGTLMTVAMLWLLRSTNLWMFYLFATVYGFAYGGFAAPTTALIGDTYGLAHLGLIMAVVDAGWGTGSSVGPAVAGYLFDISSNYATAFLSGLTAALIGTVLGLFLRQPKPRSHA